MGKKKQRRLKDLEEHRTWMRDTLDDWKILREEEEKWIRAHPSHVLGKFHLQALDCCQEHIDHCMKYLERAETNLACF